MKGIALVVDVQVGLIKGLHAYRGSGVVSTIRKLINNARECRVPVVFVQHDGKSGHRLEPGTPGWPFDPEVAPAAGDVVVSKQSCDAFHKTELQDELARRGAEHIIIVGCMTEYCIDTTCRRAVSLGYDVTLVADAHTTGDTALLAAAQIIDHHNALLDGFSASDHVIRVAHATGICLC